MTLRSNSFSGGIFSRKKNTYGMILPEEFEPLQRSNSNPGPRTRPPLSPSLHRNANHANQNKDFFAPSEMDTWELPQYQSLFHHLLTQTTQDRKFRRRLSSTSSASLDKIHLNRQDSSSSQGDKLGPIKCLQRWFREFIQSMKNDSDSEEELDPNAVVEAIPIEICEKLRYIHVYL